MINRRRAPLPTFQRLQAAMREFDNAPYSVSSNNNTNNNSNNNNNSTGVMPMMPGGYSLPSNSSHSNPNGAAVVPPSFASSACQTRHTASSLLSNSSNAAWRETAGDSLRRLRSRHIVLIERMLRNHQPHDVLTQVPENTDWRSKTFLLAIKIEKLMFLAATSQENYLNEHTLRGRVQLLGRHLVRIRKRKNAMAVATAATAV